MQQNKTQFEGIFKAGLIVNICLCSVSLGFFLIEALLAFTINLVGGLTILIFLGIFSIGIIITLVMSVKALKQKNTSSKIALGVLGIIFGGLIGGILILCAPIENTLEMQQGVQSAQNMEMPKNEENESK